MRKTLSQARLKELLNYEPKTGLFTRRMTQGGQLMGCVAGNKHIRGYIHIKIDSKTYKAHRLAFLYMTGKWPDTDVDHVDGVSNNNKWDNLRIVTHQENGKNSKRSKRNKSGYTGVSFHKAHHKWQAYIAVNGARQYLGYFDTLEEAALVRQKANIKYGYHKNHGQVP